MSEWCFENRRQLSNTLHSLLNYFSVLIIDKPFFTLFVFRIMRQLDFFYQISGHMIKWKQKRSPLGMIKVFHFLSYCLEATHLKIVSINIEIFSLMFVMRICLLHGKFCTKKSPYISLFFFIFFLLLLLSNLYRDLRGNSNICLY